MPVTVTARVLDRPELAPLWLGEQDPENDRLLVAWTAALVSCLERLGVVAYGDPGAGVDPRRVLRDPRVAPAWALPSAAQWTGGSVPERLPGETDEQYLDRARTVVVRPKGMLRGGQRSLVDVVVPLLSGPVEQRVVQVVERFGGDPWETRVLTREAQTPSVPAVLAACNADDVVVAGERVSHGFADAARVDEMTRRIDQLAGDIDTLTVTDVT